MNPDVSIPYPSGWHKTDLGSLQRIFFFSHYKDELIFANHIGEIAEELNHHPAILIEWGKCTVKTWTHETKSLTEKDFILAQKCNELFETIFSKNGSQINNL